MIVILLSVSFCSRISIDLPENSKFNFSAKEWNLCTVEKEQKNLNNIESKFNRKYVMRHELISSFLRLFRYFFRDKTPIFLWEIFFQNLAPRINIWKFPSLKIYKNNRDVQTFEIVQDQNPFSQIFFEDRENSKIRVNVENCRKNSINSHDVGQRIR